MRERKREIETGSRGVGLFIQEEEERECKIERGSVMNERVEEDKIMRNMFFCEDVASLCP